MNGQASLGTLSAFDQEGGDLLVVIETAKGSRNKYSYQIQL
jgi:hypothetical protein